MPKDIFQRIVEAPAEALEHTIKKTGDIAKTSGANGALKQTKAYWHMLGPGLTTGASDDDPSGITTYSQTGAMYGFQLLWMAIVTFPLMAFVQEMCARIGLVTGKGLAGNIRTHFSKRVLYVCTLLLFSANALNIGADLGAMAKAAQLLNPAFSFTVLVIFFTFLSLALQIFTPYARYARYLKWLALVLFAYIFSAVLAHLNWANVMHNAIVPHITFSKEQLLLICAILGTTISPYLFFWQTSQEVEEEILKGKTSVSQRQGADKTAIRNMRIDVWSGMILSNVVMFFIVAACGSILYANGIRNITSAAQAAEALRPFAGNATYTLFAIGIIGTGMLAIPVLAGSSSYALAESFKWKEGLYRNLKQALAFYGVIILSLLIGLGINFLNIDPIKALIYAAVGNGIVAPIILALIVLISSNKKIMGEWANRPVDSFIGWLTTGLMAAAGIAAIYAIFS
jgi:NRAMP (natural resistance-associated macrophage protein)-like metal ion transporter